jgi:hypothetical protein
MESEEAGGPAGVPDDLSARVRELLGSVAGADRSTALALHAILSAANEIGVAPFD